MRTVQPRRARPRTVAVVAVVAFLGGGCGLGDDPSVSSAEEVVASLVSLGEESRRARLSAAIEVDEGELRALVRDQPALLDLLPSDAAPESDELLSALRDARASLERVAVLADAGDDGSVRYALVVDDEVVVDVRGRAAGDEQRGDPLAPAETTFQAMVDLDRVATLADELAWPPDASGSGTVGTDHDDVGDRVADARASIDALGAQLGAVIPDAAPLLDLVTAVLDGELVEITGTLDPRAWLESTASALGADPTSAEGELGALLAPAGGAAAADAIDPAELYRTLFTFDGFRVEGSATVVDVDVELRRGGDRLLARLEERLADTAAGAGTADRDVAGLRARVDELRAALERAPDRLEDVGTLRFGADGQLEQARLELLDVAAQLAAAADPDDPDAALLADAAAGLERTGVSLTVAVDGVGELPSVLGDPATSVTWEELREVVGSLAATVGGLLGGLAGGGLADGLPDLAAPGDGLDDLLDGVETGLRPDEVPVGACFDDTALFADGDGATTVPCEQPHDNEAFAVVELGGPDDPYDPTVVVTASSRCDEPFEQYVGTPYLESSYFHATIAPTRREWDEDGLRAAVCYLFDVEPQTGSAAGSGR